MKTKALLLALVLAAIALGTIILRRGAVHPSAARAAVRPVEAATVVAPPGATNAGSVTADPSLEREPEGPGSVTLYGVVADGAGRPVEGALVVVDSVPPRTVDTSMDGSFVIEGLVPRTYVLAARKGSLVARPTTVSAMDSAGTVRLRLGEGASVVVNVVDGANREPIVGADVELHGLVVRTARSDGEGSARFEGAGGEAYVVRARGPGFAPATIALASGAETGELRQTLLLRRGAAVRGTVVDEDGIPVEGARVAAEAASTLAPAHVPIAEVTTDDMGHFAYTSLAPGTYRVRVFDGQHAAAESSVVVVSERGAPEIHVVMTKGARVSGRVVTDEGPGAPFARVRLRALEGGFGRAKVKELRADASGTFTVSGLALTHYEISASDGHASSKPIAIDASNAAALTLVLDQRASLRGEVVSKSGAKIAGAIVRAVSGDATVLANDLMATSDERGGFELRGLLGQKYILRSAWPGAHPGKGLEATRPGVRVSIGTFARIVLEDDGALRGSVRAGGAPVAGATVAVDGAPATMVSEAGTFVVERVPPGPHTLVATAPGLAPKVVTSIVVTAGHDTDVGELTLEPGRAIHGRVTTESGAPVAGATVMVGSHFVGDGSSLTSADAKSVLGQIEATTGRDGTFRIEGIGPSARLAMAEHTDFGRSKVHALEENGDTELVLRAGGTIVGRVSANGHPAEGVLVSAFSRQPGESPADMTLAATTGPDGEYRLENVGAGSYLVAGVAQNGRQTSGSKIVDVVVTAGKAVRVDLEMPPPGKMTLVVRGAGERYEAQRVLLDGPRTEVHELSRGRPATFEGIQEGKYSLCFWRAASAVPGPEKQCRDVVVEGSPVRQEIMVTPAAARKEM